MDEKSHKDYIHTSSILRGYIINQVVLLERMIDIYLARFFTDNESKEILFLELICGSERFAFSTKKDILMYLLKHFDSQLYLENPKMEGDLQEIMKVRNNLAHHYLDASKSGLESFKNNIITITKLTHKEKQFPYTQEYIDELQDKIIGYVMLFANHLNKVKESLSPLKNSPSKTDDKPSSEESR